ncbi:MAG: right-handed parallel beta-helix repeat-containing protein [Deltaproteobacteria bacterium]|nr:right-handed parallel beta-helix repeat-containing protein [Deltaproteobacteria bacterium]
MSMIRSVAALSLLLFGLTLSPWSISAASATYCGDDVGGRRVACGCGDTVVSDTTLHADDPVVTGRCPLDGLILRASPFADSIRLDLAGLTVSGAPYGVGILVLAGGASGAIITGGDEQKATILGFGTGVLSERVGALLRVEGLEIRGVRGDGIRIRGRGVFLVDVEAAYNSGDGIRLSGTGGRLVRTATHDNGGNGLRLFVDGAAVEAVTFHNTKDGAVVRGRRNDLSGLRARDNAGTGLVLQGRDNMTQGLVSELNGAADVLSVSGGGAR